MSGDKCCKGRDPFDVSRRLLDELVVSARDLLDAAKALRDRVDALREKQGE